MKYLDVGGGLGIDYDGSQTDFESSVNYTLEEYARDVVYHIQNICDEARGSASDDHHGERAGGCGVSQRAGFQCAGRQRIRRRRTAGERAGRFASSCLIDLFETHRSINKKNLLETYHDAQQALDSALNLFSLGYLTLEQRSLAENFYWAICRKILKAMPRSWNIFPKSWKVWTACCPIPTSAIFRCSRACRTAGR